MFFLPDPFLITLSLRQLFHSTQHEPSRCSTPAIELRHLLLRNHHPTTVYGLDLSPVPPLRAYPLNLEFIQGDFKGLVRPAADEPPEPAPRARLLRSRFQPPPHPRHDGLAALRRCRRLAARTGRVRRTARRVLCLASRLAAGNIPPA
ncbi:uncharacterized protein K441DRAFT_29022 [Cenococcum geophilum 1.58]|uniref:uncharacterized protein n=1 Tax=Cenococcum geophilum 1.58 TaxID=794803 RepID=UPI00358EB1AB|nr:hypothetical protein K441DRAFT_29022 [Cenococcum geophilum 1.58]